jgi:alpha-L-rhamnosidase
VPPEDPILIHSKDPARKTDPALLASAYLYYDAMLLRRYALILGKSADAEQFEKIASGLKTALNTRLYDKEKGYYANGSQTSCVLPLAFGIAPEEERERVFGRLIDKITNESHNHIGTGLIGGQWLMRTLTRHARPDLAWTIASQDTYPSWGYMVRKGATTVWELWNGDTADPAMNSGNHVMLVGDLLTWMFEDLAGIRPDPQQPGFSHILMKPELPPGLDWVKASHKSPYGQITSEWSRRRELFQWQVRIPPNTTAQLEVPCPSAGAVLESGKPVARANGIRLIEYRNGRQILEAGSGTYRFETLVGPK